MENKGSAWMGVVVFIAMGFFIYYLHSKPIGIQQICKDNAFAYFKSGLDRPETFNCTKISPADTISIKGDRERFIYIEFNYRTKQADIKHDAGFIYLDTLGNVLRFEDRN